MKRLDRTSPVGPTESERGVGVASEAVVSGNAVQEQGDRSALQTELAAERTILAVERTYDAWIRTGLTALAYGIGARTLLTGIIPHWLTKTTGAMLVLFAAVCFMAGAWREISANIELPKPRIRRLPPAMLVIVNGFLMLVALTAFVGVVAMP